MRFFCLTVEFQQREVFQFKKKKMKRNVSPKMWRGVWRSLGEAVQRAPSPSFTLVQGGAKEQGDEKRPWQRLAACSVALGNSLRPKRSNRSNRSDGR